MAGNFFGGEFFGGGFFGANTPSDQPQASNWQAHYWERDPFSHRSKKQREEDRKAERIRLGILPPELREVADEAVRDATAAAVEVAAGRADEATAIFQQLAAREAYENAYKDAYANAYIAEVVAEHWREDMKRQTRRRKAALLLLH